MKYHQILSLYTYTQKKFSFHHQESDKSQSLYLPRDLVHIQNCIFYFIFFYRNTTALQNCKKITFILFLFKNFLKKLIHITWEEFRCDAPWWYLISPSDKFPLYNILQDNIHQWNCFSYLSKCDHNWCPAIFLLVSNPELHSPSLFELFRKCIFRIHLLPLLIVFIHS